MLNPGKLHDRFGAVGGDDPLAPVAVGEADRQPGDDAAVSEVEGIGLEHRPDFLRRLKERFEHAPAPHPRRNSRQIGPDRPPAPGVGMTLPAAGGFLGKTIAIDALIKATVAGLGQWPNTPDFTTSLTSFQVKFNTAVTGFTIASFKLQRLDVATDPTSGRDVSLAGVSVSGSSTNWTITLPSATNPTSLPGRYKLVIGGVGSGIKVGTTEMDVPVEWFFDRI